MATPSDFKGRHCRAFHVGTSLLVLAAFAGCGGEREPPRYDLSGAVTYGGQPVPAGYIEFVPDTSQDNKGPGTSAEIRDGRYATLPQRGTIGGPHIAKLHGFDGMPPSAGAAAQAPAASQPAIHALFTVEVQVDLPKETSAYDFDIP